jgi:hypothetical protein
VNSSNLAFALGSWANHLAPSTRKAFYKATKIVASVATVALIVLPYLPQVGVNLPPNVQWDAVLTALLAFLGHLADRNTVTEPAVDMTTAPEGMRQQVLDASAPAPDPVVLPVAPVKPNPAVSPPHKPAS